MINSLIVFSAIAAGQKPKLIAPSDALGVGGFYTKLCFMNKLPIRGSAKVSDDALVRAHAILLKMTSKCRREVVASMVKERCTFSIIGKTEGQTDLPEYSDLRNDPNMDWNKRARGLGGKNCSAGEENILELPEDRYKGESIIIHEFSHTMETYGFRKTDPSFEKSLKEAFANAQQTKLWEKTYAITNEAEYFAEGVQSYFDCNRFSDPPNGIHNHINSRAKLAEYDPRLFALVDRCYGKNSWRYDGKYRADSKSLKNR